MLAWYYQPYFNTGNYALAIDELSPFNSGLFDLGRVTFAGLDAGRLLDRRAGRHAHPPGRPGDPGHPGRLRRARLRGRRFLREHYLTPLVTTSPNLPGSAWVLGQWWTKGGAALSQATMVNVMDPLFYRLIPPASKGGDAHLFKQQAIVEVMQYLTRHGYTYWTRYQPGSRYWPFQWIEGGWLLALSVLLIAATVWLVRRRAA